MNSTALILMLTVQGTVAVLTAFFFWKVLSAPLPQEKSDADEDTAE